MASTTIAEGASPAEYLTGLNLAIERGWLWQHPSKTYVKFTPAGADLFAGLTVQLLPDLRVMSRGMRHTTHDGLEVVLSAFRGTHQYEKGDSLNILALHCPKN